MIAFDKPLCSRCLRERRSELAEYRYETGKYGTTYLCFAHAAKLKHEDKHRLHYLKGEQ